MSGHRSVLDGAFRVLHALPDAGTAHQVTNLAQLTGLPRSTVHRLLTQLREVGAVDLVDRRWTLSTGLAALAQRVEPHAGLRRPAADVLRVLRQQTGATVSLVVAAGADTMVLEIVPGTESMPADARSGAVLPGFTAAGVLLTSRPRASRSGVAVDHGDLWAGLTCYAVPVSVPGGRAALQLATVSRRAEMFAGAMHHAAAALTRQVKG